MSDSRPSHKAIHNAIRNVLINEMGVNRGDVDKVLTDYLQKRVEQTVQQLLDNGSINAWIRSEIHRLANKNLWTPDALKEAMKGAAKQEMAKFVENNLQVKWIGGTW